MNNRDKVIDKLRELIYNFKDIDKYNGISFIGSLSNGDHASDVDLVSISDEKTHRAFKKYLKSEFLKEGINIIFFKSIVDKHRFDGNNIMFHDLHYSSLNSFLKKEWKSVINTIKKENIVLYGENFSIKIPYQDITFSDFFSPLYSWSKKINSQKNFTIFQAYLLSIEKRFYEYGFDNEFKKIKLIINLNISWKDKLNQIWDILKV